MYLECTHGLTCPSSLWLYQLPRFSSTSSGLFPWLNGSTLGDCLPFPCEEWGSWAKTYHFLLHSYFSIFSCLSEVFSWTPSDKVPLIADNNNIYKIYIYIWCGEFGFICWGARGPTLVSFLFYVNVSGVHSWSYLASQLLTLCVGWLVAPCLLFPCKE